MGNSCGAQRKTARSKQNLTSGHQEKNYRKTLTSANINTNRTTHEKSDKRETAQVFQTFDILPLELLDMILQKSYLLFVRKTASSSQKNIDVIFSLASVSYFWFQWITRAKFKRSVWRHLRVVLKAELIDVGTKQNQQSIDKLNDVLINNMENNQKTKILISQLERDDIHILSSSKSKGNGIVLWICSPSQDSLERLHEMYNSKRFHQILRDLFSSVPSGLEFSMQMKFKLDSSYFGRNVSVRSIATSFRAKLEIEGNPGVRGVTKLWKQIHVLCRYCPSNVSMFQDENPFRCLKEMEMNEISFPSDIVSSEKENCLYVSGEDAKGNRCIWRIKESDDGGHQVTKWLEDIKSQSPLTLSVSSAGQLLTAVNDNGSSCLMIYGPDAELRHSIPLSSFDRYYSINHAVETSRGSFIISHSWMKSKSEFELFCGVSEVRIDGSVIRRFKNRNQELIEPHYLSLDSDDRLIVAHYYYQHPIEKLYDKYPRRLYTHYTGRVILLDPDLKLNRILIATVKDGNNGIRIDPRRLCYDEEKKQLIIGGEYGVYVYCSLELEINAFFNAGLL